MPFPSPRSPVRLVLTDVDDTLTWEGRLPHESLRAMYRLQEAGIDLIPVTGACAGWCDQMARTWPVAAVIGENGAFVIERRGRHLHYHDTQDAALRAANLTRLGAVGAQLAARFPGLAPARDNGYRRYDFALDHAQEVAPVAAAIVAEALVAAHALGVQATASSIHINLWLGEFSKRRSTSDWLQRRYGWDDAQAAERAVFIGDSLNDAQMFEAYPHSVGVANIRPHLSALPRAPAHITREPGGLGFAEWVNAGLSAQR
ncbi:HAD-IIB family hydrolase [Niveibacterium sp. SC-1]|uniref:HAD family hydrolase n=1 Tax=Niveibacterium sp. SC-1 TaxID=3135646 RepID=UPI00311E7A81